MFFKLLMPSVDRLMKGGIVGKWHKNEGDHVDYGDDLVDVKVELMMRTPQRSLDQDIRLLLDGGSVRDRDLASVAGDGAIMVVCVTSSDVGVLRRIEVKEGAYGEAGSLLAVLSTEDHGSTNPLDEDLREASEFRVVANLVGY